MVSLRNKKNIPQLSLNIPLSTALKGSKYFAKGGNCIVSRCKIFISLTNLTVFLLKKNINFFYLLYFFGYKKRITPSE